MVYTTNRFRTNLSFFNNDYRYVIIAVPTGIVGAEIAKHKYTSLPLEELDDDATYCKFCGANL